MRPRRVRSLFASTALLLAAAACAAVPPGSAAPPVPSEVRWPETGALFGGPPSSPGDHYCSAAVIDGPGGDVVVTAAHCVAAGDGSPARTGMSFVPGYHDHLMPLGVFAVTAAHVDGQWLRYGDPDHDVAFLTVSRAGSPPVEQLTGGYRLVLDAGAGAGVDAIGYPDLADAPAQRSGVLRAWSATQWELPAHGLYDGTSGGPWLLADGPDGVDVDVIGVTGGYQQGGLDPETSYAVRLGAAAAALLHTVHPG